jgi:hypothetical protein
MKKYILGAGSFIFIFAKNAAACGMCGFAVFDLMAPPVFYWCVFAAVWYLLLSLLADINKVKLLACHSRWV